ncbi:MAG: type II secretion system F family protein [Candidatus Nanoarchaeia archaeon]
MEIYKLAHKLFKKWSEKYLIYFKKLGPKLKEIDFKKSLEEYVSFIFLISFLAFLISLPLLLVLFVLLHFKYLAIILSLLSSLGIGICAFLFTYFYPLLQAEEKKKRLENALPFATLYLASLAHAGFPPQKLFEFLAKFKEYGELSKEAEKINIDLKVFGLDIPTALLRAINRSPSPTWNELLAGIRTTITVGGDLAKYLEEKVDSFTTEYKKNLEEYSAFLSSLTEIYITVIIVGAVFFLIISSIMSAIGAVSVTFLKAINLLIVIGGIPILTLMFILIAKGLSPTEA